MPNPSQEKLISYNLTNQIKIINEYQGVDLGTKIRYMEKAISENCNHFLNSLDKLYNPDLTGPDHDEHIKFMGALKKLNDLNFNNNIKNSRNEVRKALNFFSQYVDVDENAVQQKVQKIVKATIKKTNKVEGFSEIIEAQIKERIAAEENINPNPAWRKIVDLPEEQVISQVDRLNSLISSVDTVDELAEFIEANPKDKKGLYEQVIKDTQFNRLTRGIVSFLGGLVKLFPEHREDFYNKIDTDVNFKKFTKGNISQLELLLKLFPEHRKEIYAQVVKEESYKSFTQERSDNLDRLINIFPEHEEELNSLVFDYWTPQMGERPK